MTSKFLSLAMTISILCISIVELACFQTAHAKSAKPASSSESSELSYKTGKQKLKEHDVDGAMEDFGQAIRLARNNYFPAAYYALGVCYKAKGQDTQAIYAFNIHLKQAVGASPDAHIELGELYMRNNLNAQAENEFNQALADYRGPAPKAHNALGKLMQKQGDLANAQYQFEQAVSDSHGTFGDAWLSLAELQIAAQSWDEAIRQLNDMLKAGKNLKDADWAKVHIDYGLCLFAKGDHQQALEHWQESATINPSLPQPHLLLARMFELEKHISSAIKEYRTYASLEPNPKDAQSARDKIAALEQLITPVPSIQDNPPPSTNEKPSSGQNAPQDSGF